MARTNYSHYGSVVLFNVCCFWQLGAVPLSARAGRPTRGALIQLRAAWISESIAYRRRHEYPADDAADVSLVRGGHLCCAPAANHRTYVGISDWHLLELCRGMAADLF